MRNFTTYSVAVQFYRLSRELTLPSQLSDQLKRAAVSVVCNLAEGRGKPTLKDQLRFFHIAFGSVRECQAILDMANLLNSNADKQLDKLAAHLYRLIRNAR